MSRLSELILCLVTCTATMVSAATYKPATVPNPKISGQDSYVSNPDSILSADDVEYLNRCCRMLEDSTEVEMAIVVLDSIGGYTPFDFGYELFQRWGIGKAGRNTGVLITFALASRQVQINTGSGIEGVLPDARCSRIIEENMIPRFKMGDYGGGLCAGATAIYTICTNGDAPEELLNMTSATNRGKFASADKDEISDWTLWIAISVLVFLTLLPFLLIVLYQRKTQSTTDEMEQRKGCLTKMICVAIIFPFIIPTVIWFWHRSKRSRCPKCGKQRYKVVLSTKTDAAGGGRLLNETYRCSACGYEHHETTVIPVSSYSGGYSGDYDSDDSYDSYDSDSSSGSWGGGSSSGGGAGGSW